MKSYGHYWLFMNTEINVAQMRDIFMFTFRYDIFFFSSGRISYIAVVFKLIFAAKSGIIFNIGIGCYAFFNFHSAAHFRGIPVISIPRTSLT